MKALLILLLASLSLTAQADIFKCTDPQTKRTRYQPKPCASTVVERRIEVKRRGAEEEAAAAERLHNWRARQTEEDVWKEKIAKEKQEAWLRAAEIDAAQRNVAAQQELARAQHRLFKEMSRQPVTVLVPDQTFISPARIDAGTIPLNSGNGQGPAAAPDQPGAGPRVGANATGASRWGTQRFR